MSVTHLAYSISTQEEATQSSQHMPLISIRPVLIAVITPPSHKKQWTPLPTLEQRAAFKAKQHEAKERRKEAAIARKKAALQAYEERMNEIDNELAQFGMKDEEEAEEVAEEKPDTLKKKQGRRRRGKSKQQQQTTALNSLTLAATSSSLFSLLTTFLALLVIFITPISATTASSSHQYLTDSTFAAIKLQPASALRLSVFYHSSHPSSQPLLDTIETTASSLHSLDQPNLHFISYTSIDCDDEVNRVECTEAGFAALDQQWIFTTFDENNGIQVYKGARDVSSLSTHIQQKLLHLNFNTQDVREFMSETAFWNHIDLLPSSRPKPMFAKFDEAGCIECVQLHRTYQQAATYFKDTMDFFQIDCTRDEETNEFCQRQRVTSYPTFILFDGEMKYRYTAAEKSITSFEKFFLTSTQPPAPRIQRRRRRYSDKADEDDSDDEPRRRRKPMRKAATEHGGL